VNFAKDIVTFLLTGMDAVLLNCVDNVVRSIIAKFVREILSVGL
jgi:hypothetical protein